MRGLIKDIFPFLLASSHKLGLLIWLVIALPTLIFVRADQPVLATTSGFVPTAWSHNLPADTCYEQSSTDCHVGSPTLADINGDGFLDIIAVTNNGHVVVRKHNGSLLWDKDIAPAFGMSPGKHEIHSSPAVADIDQDGYLEIAVGAGTTHPNVCTQGGLILLDHNGNVEPGWPALAADGSVLPSGCRDSIFATPALGDLDNDGDLEVVAAGFDKRVYAWHHDGTLLPGFPPSSHHRSRFPTWTDLRDRLADNTWGSPALADLDGDGYLDIVLATAEGNFDASFGGDAGGWTCPYDAPAGGINGYCGGSVYVFDRQANVLPGFPRYFLEAMGSTPAVADVNNDGRAEIFVGAGDYYYKFSPDHPTYGLRMYGLDFQGNDLPGWSGGKSVGAGVQSSASIGDIAGDSQPEIVVGGMNRRLYAWNVDGSAVSGFPMKPLDHQGNANLGYMHGASFPLADYDGDDKMEIFVNQSWGVIIVDGNGQQFTSSNYPADNKPIYYTGGTLFNTPAVGDIDNDGKLELIATHSRMHLWNLDDSSDAVDWGMFKYDASRLSFDSKARLAAFPKEFIIFHQVGNTSNAQELLPIHNVGQGVFNWQASTPSGIWMSPDNGLLQPGESAMATVNIDTQGLGKGVYPLGNITISATMEDGVVLNSPSEHTVTLIVGDINQFYLPLISK